MVFSAGGTFDPWNIGWNIGWNIQKTASNVPGHVPGNVPGNVPGKTLENTGFFGKWNIGTFIFY